MRMTTYNLWAAYAIGDLSLKLNTMPNRDEFETAI